MPPRPNGRARAREGAWLEATRRRWLAAGARFAVLALAAGSFALAAGSFALAQAIRYSHAPAKITVGVPPITAFDPRDESKIRFGELEFRGGLVLTSSYPGFGGISALYMEPDGKCPARGRASRTHRCEKN